MTVRLQREDLEKLLELVERYQLAGQEPSSWATTSVLPPDRGIWLENRKYWEANLRAASDGDWSDEQYAETADLLNAAEYQRIVFSEFADALARGVLSTAGPHFPPAESEGGTTFVETVSLINATTGEPEELSLSPAIAAVRDTGLGLAHGPWGPCGRPDSPENDPSALARLSERQIDLSSLAALRTRDGLPTALNVVRAELFAQTGVSALRPYGGWDDFKVRNDLPDTLVDDLKAAYPDGFETVDVWVGGLAEQPVVGDLGPTLVALLHGELESVAPAELAALDLVQSNGLSHLLSDRSISDIIVDPAHQFSDEVGLDGSGLTFLFGTDGGDVIRGSARPEIIYGGQGDDVIFGGPGDDILYGEEGDDYLYGGPGRDQLFGEEGDDVLDGGIDADLMIGGIGNDTYFVDDAGDVVIEAAGEGNDTVKTTLTEYVLSDNVENLIAIGDQPMFTGTGNAEGNLIKGTAEGQNILYGLDGDDCLIGGKGDDYLYGGDGDDYIDGGDGKNYIDGGAGNDTMRGSRRNDDDDDDRDHLSSASNELFIATNRSDTFVLREGFGHDIIIDFDANSSGKGGRDRIDVSAYLTFDKHSIGTDILISSIGSSTVVTIGSDTLTLIGVDPREIDASNFIFK